MGVSNARQAGSRRGCRLVGLSGGQEPTPKQACALVTFRSWLPREIARLSVQAAQDSRDIATLVREVVGTDLTEREHIVLFGVGKKTNKIIAIADGTSLEKSVCYYSVPQMLGALFQHMDAGELGGIVMGHNHPSGDAQASAEDIRSTHKFVCQFNVVPLLDHVIASTGTDRNGARVPAFRRFFSMLDEYGDGLLKPPACK